MTATATVGDDATTAAATAASDAALEAIDAANAATDVQTLLLKLQMLQPLLLKKHAMLQILQQLLLRLLLLRSPH